MSATMTSHEHTHINGTVPCFDASYNPNITLAVDFRVTVANNTNILVVVLAARYFYQLEEFPMLIVWTSYKCIYSGGE